MSKVSETRQADLRQVAETQYRQAVRLLPDHGYKTSKDYHRLFRLMQEKAFICIVTCYGCRDVASTIYNEALWEVSSRGVGHVWAETEDKFIANCEAVSLEFLEHNPS